MKSVFKEYQKSYVNVLAKLGEVALILDKNERLQADLLDEASKMWDVLHSLNSEPVENNGEKNGLGKHLETIEGDSESS